MSNSAILSGADFKRFYSDPAVWQDGTYHEDILIKVDGADAVEADIDLTEVSDGARVEILSGEIVDGPASVPHDLADAAEWWLKQQTCVRYLVEVPASCLAAFEQAMASLGISVESSRPVHDAAPRADVPCR